jgi:hypothetical protein
MAKEVATKAQNELTPAQLAKLEELYGTGESISKAPEDNIIPLVYVLQPLTPQAQAHRPEYLPGAVPGSIWLKNAADPIVPGNVGILFQPCVLTVEWIEWVPRDKGGGLAGIWPNKKEGRNDVPDCPDAKATHPDGQGFPSWTRPNGNDLILTRSHAGFVIRDGMPLPYSIPFSSSGLTISRAWNTRMGSKYRKSGLLADPWCVVYRLKTVAKHNNKGDWFAFDIFDTGEADGYGPIGNVVPAGFLRTEEDIERGKEFAKRFATGEVKAEAPAHTEEMKDEIPF